MGTDVSFPSGKIPISTLESYSYCKKQGILSLRKKEIRKKDTKKKVIGRILHEVFKNFHEEWPNMMDRFPLLPLLGPQLLRGLTLNG